MEMSLITAESFEQVMEFYMPTVYRIAFSRLANRSDAEDITQDVFLRYFKADLTYNDEEHRKAWLIRCAINCTKSMATSAWFRHRAPEEELEHVGAADTLGEFELRDTVMNAVMKLPPKYRTVIHLFYYEDMSVAQISKVTGTKEATVKSQLSRARDMLRPMLEEVDF